MSNPTAEDTTTAPNVLRDADRVVEGDRELTFVWDLGEDPEGGTYQAALSVGHHKHQRGGAFSATLLNRTEEGNTIRMSDILTSWARIDARSVPRYSKVGLEACAHEALTKLREKYGTDDDEGRLLTAYFAPQQTDTSDTASEDDSRS
jgi:hypothetical protein